MWSIFRIHVVTTSGTSIHLQGLCSKNSTWSTSNILPFGYLTYSSHGKSPFLIGKPSINGPFSTAMLNNQRVTHLEYCKLCKIAWRIATIYSDKGSLSAGLQKPIEKVDWFKGKLLSRKAPWSSWENRWFPVRIFLPIHWKMAGILLSNQDLPKRSRNALRPATVSHQFELW